MNIGIDSNSQEKFTDAQTVWHKYAKYRDSCTEHMNNMNKQRHKHAEQQTQTHKIICINTKTTKISQKNSTNMQKTLKTDTKANTQADRRLNTNRQLQSNTKQSDKQIDRLRHRQTHTDTRKKGT